jgi:SNF2 family DNA or RNA helicase
MQIIDNRAVLLTVKSPDLITNNIGKSAVVGQTTNGLHKVLIHWTLENARKLSSLGVRKMLAPIEREYDWPGFEKPYEHQKTTAAFLAAHPRAFCFNSQGTGKTKSVIWAADYLLRKKDVTRVLVLCPVSVMPTWLDEIFRTAMHRTAAICHGSREQRQKVLAGDYEFVIINYDGVPVVRKELAAYGFDLIVIDEANYVKTATTRRWKTTNSLITPSTKVWMLTGTPAAQSPLDAYGLAKMTVPQNVPKFFGAWRDAVMVKLSAFRWEPHPRSTKLVNLALQPAIRFTKEDCLDLPPVTYQTRLVPLSAQQAKFYAAMKKRALIEAAGEQITAVHAAAGMNKLLQLSAGAVYSDTGEVVQFDASARIQEVIDIVENATAKTLVFVPFRHAIDIVTDALRKAGISTEVISGAVSLNARRRIFDDFQQTEDPRVLVIQPQSASHGVTLTAADTIVWFGPVASVETWLQANERINRPSQKNKMTIIKIYGSPVEKKLYDALESREVTQKLLTSLYEEAIHT